MTTIRLATDGTSYAYDSLQLIPRGCDRAPSLLVAWPFYRKFNRVSSELKYRGWALDSGAFSVYESGAHVDIEQYIDSVHKIMAGRNPPEEVFALDVIGDHKRTLLNTRRMHDAGIPAIPCFHIGSPWGALVDLASTNDKIAIGGMARGISRSSRSKAYFFDQCFGRIWPKKVHGFGLMNEKILMKVPFHSVDATNWQMAPLMYGQYKTRGHLPLLGKIKQANFASDIDWYLELERRVSFRWRRELAEL